MSSNTTKEPVIIETSETELISGTESLSDHGNTKKIEIDNTLSLDALFNKLSEETKNETSLKEQEDEFTKIKKTISLLPKIQSKLEQNMEKQIVKDKKKSDIVRINDPIVHRKPAKTEVEDAGSKWFNMKQPELTSDLKRDLSIIKQRSALDPKRHYKKDKWEIPKYFHMGTIIEGNTEFYSARLSKRARGTSLVDEVLKDNDANKYFKRKYSEIQQAKTSGGKAHYKKVKQMRKKF